MASEYDTFQCSSIGRAPDAPSRKRQHSMAILGPGDELIARIPLERPSAVAGEIVISNTFWKDSSRFAG